MSFLNSFFSFLPTNIPTWLLHQSHSEDYEYGGGRHGRPCRACNDFKSWVQTSKPSKTQTPPTPPASSGSGPEHDKKKECPLDKDELGRNSWSLMHTMAAYYPEKPSEEEQSSMKNFIDGLSRFYPCEACASDFRVDIRENPPTTASRSELSNWWCRAHNRVNKKLGKAQFDCSKVDERWVDGWKDGSCDS